MQLWHASAIALAVIFTASRLTQFYNNKKKLGDLPGIRCLLSTMHPLGVLVPTCALNPGLLWSWLWKDRVYRDAGTETIAVLPLLLGPPVVYTSSPEVLRQVVAMKGHFEKPPEGGKYLRLWGPNVFSDGGEEWRRHRRVLQPAFGPRTYALVCAQTAALYDEMVAAEGWAGVSTLELPSINPFTNKLALLVISRCGFGSALPWRADAEKDGGMPLQDALTLVSPGALPRLLVPRWMYRLPIRWLRELDEAFAAVRRFMRELVASRRRELAGDEKVDWEGHRDVFRLMLEASEQEGDLALSDEELQGNTFVMLFAGHDTTSHTLSAAIAFLALHPEIQQDVYEQIRSVLDKEELTLATLQKLDKVQACFLEAARLFPAAFLMVRRTLTDVVVTHAGPHNLASETLPLEAGTMVCVDTVGLQYNPRVFPDPYSFKPERWHGAGENDMTMFSVGARSCIGRRFALTEGTTFLARLLNDWQVEPLLKPGESVEEWKARVLTAKIKMTLGIGEVPVRLRRRI